MKPCSNCKQKRKQRSKPKQPSQLPKGIPSPIPIPASVEIQIPSEEDFVWIPVEKYDALIACRTKLGIITGIVLNEHNASAFRQHLRDVLFADTWREKHE